MSSNSQLSQAGRSGPEETTMQMTDRILFIDDDPPVRAAFARCVGRQGLNVDLAQDAESALNLASTKEYAVIAADYRMPDVDGLTLVEDVRKVQPHATYMLISGECDLELAMEAVNEHGLSFVVTKPWDANELGSMLRRSIESYWERRASTKMQSSAVETCKRLEEQKRKLQEALRRSELLLGEMLLNALEVRDHETREHCRRVAAYSRVLAQQLGVAESYLPVLEQGALLHDVGKVAIPDAILHKPAKLTEDEMVLVRQHPLVGARVLEGFETLSEVRKIVIQHHERWDGTGYPHSLYGNSICLGARLFAVADALDAMLARRAYQEPRDLEQASQAIAAGAGTQFDPEVVKAFLAVPSERWLAVAAEYSQDAAATA